MGKTVDIEASEGWNCREFDPAAASRWLQHQADDHSGYPHGIVGYAFLDLGAEVRVWWGGVGVKCNGVAFVDLVVWFLT